MARVIRVGVLGLTHDHVWDNLSPLAQSERGQLIAAADPHRPLLDRLTQAYPCTTYESAEALLDAETLDAVYVFSSNANGAQLAIAAMQRGLHVLIEKPMAASLSGADQMIAAARRAGVKLLVNWPFAWWPQLQYALSLALAGEIGELWQVKYRAAHAGPEELGCSEYFCQWLFDPRENGAGAMMDYCCYGCLLARVLLGMPTRVTAVAGRFLKESIRVEDNALIAMEYPRAMATAEASWTQVGNLTSYTTAIYGSAGTLLVEPGTGGRLLMATAKHPAGRQIDVPDPPPRASNSAEHFLQCLAGGTDPLPLCRDRHCRDVQEILAAGLLASRRRQAVSLPLSISGNPADEP